MGMQLLQRVSNDSLAAIILPEPQKLPPRSFIWPLISLNAFFYRSMDGNGVVTGPSLLEAGDSEYVALTRLGIKPKVAVFDFDLRWSRQARFDGLVSIK